MRGCDVKPPLGHFRVAAGCRDVGLAIDQARMRREHIIRQLPQPAVQGGPLTPVHQHGRAAGYDPGGAVRIAYLDVEGDCLVVGAGLK